MEARRYQRFSTGNIALVIVLLAVWLVGPAPASAQDNLLTNGGFEQAHGDGVNLTAPPGWRVTSNTSSGLVGRQLRVGTEVAATAGIYSGNGSFNAFKGWAAFNVTLYQTVSGIQAGSTLRLEAFGRMWSCDSDPAVETSDACITGDGGVVAQDYTGASFRVGIDPTGSDDPNSPNVVWSAATAPYAAFQQMAVEAAAQGDRVTVLLNAGMQQPARHQHVFWDAASLTLTSGSTTGTTSSQTSSAPAIAAIVAPQGERSDGSVIHTVRSGDTIAAIAVAYNITIPELLELNGMTMDDARYIYPGQELIIEHGSGEEAPVEEPAEQGEEAPPEDSPAAEQPTGDTLPIESYDPAPVAAEDMPALAMSDTTAESRVCVLLFEDTNPNRLQESGEGLLAGGHVSLIEDEGEVGAYMTDGQNEPHCFTGLPAGEYIVIMTPPDGYGMTTANVYSVLLQAGQQVTAQFGAADGFVPPQPPAPQGVGLFSDGADTEAEAAGPLDAVLANAGLILLGAAGVVLIGGIGVSLLLRR